MEARDTWQVVGLCGRIGGSHLHLPQPTLEEPVTDVGPQAQATVRDLVELDHPDTWLQELPW